MQTVKNYYFKASPGLISGIDLTRWHEKPTHFIGCRFHPVCDDLIRKNTSPLIIWHFTDCEGLPHDIPNMAIHYQF